ncbi:MAG: LarC family nickel insertion protein, partial [Clostridiales Family XIII bacterium]|nr:LarC family nickel insertion protein [Clostridiales Family XIII bacterium]
MKRVLYFDCVAGISGDMTLGALIHLGADAAGLRAELDKLGVSGFSLAINKAQMNGITGVNLDVRIDGAGEEDAYTHAHAHGGADHSHDGEGGHRHDHGHAHVHAHTHDHARAREHAHARGTEEGAEHRSFKSIRALIESSGLNDAVKRSAVAIFSAIAEAEAAVHDMPVEEVVFHEVGALDSIVDIVGAAICVDMLGADEILCSPVHDGSGFI